MVTDLVWLEFTLGVMALTVAVLAWLANSPSGAGRAVAVLMAVEGLGWFGVAQGLSTWRPEWGAAEMFASASLAAAPWLYAIYVLRALHVAPGRRMQRVMEWLLLIMAVAAPVAVLIYLESDPFLQAIHRSVGLVSGPYLAVATWALVRGIRALPKAKDPRRARVLVAAFAVRDVAMLLLFASLLWFRSHPEDASWHGSYVFGVKILLAMHLGLVLFGLVTGRVFDLSARMRATIQRAVVAFGVALVFIIVSETLETVLSSSFGSALVAAAVIGITFQPIQSLAERLMAGIMPDTAVFERLTPRRRREIYRGQLETAYEDGELGIREQTMLLSLAQELGLRPEDTLPIQQEVDDAAVQRIMEARVDEEIHEPRGE